MKAAPSVALDASPFASPTANWSVSFSPPVLLAQPSYLIHDRDSAFFPLDQMLRSAGIKAIKTPPQSPMRHRRS
jgi:hypothetical protein